MKARKYWAVAVLLFAAIVSFFLPCIAYFPLFSHQVIERPWDSFLRWAILGKVFYLIVFTPAVVCAIQQTRLERNLTVLFIASLISPLLLFYASIGLNFHFFEVQVTFFFGYYLFLGLGAIGCLGFWALAAREIWRRIRARFPSRQALAV